MIKGSLVKKLIRLTLSYISTHFNTHLRKKLHENIVEKGEIAQNEPFHLFSTMFPMQSISQNPLTVSQTSPGFYVSAVQVF